MKLLLSYCWKVHVLARMASEVSLILDTGVLTRNVPGQFVRPVALGLASNTWPFDVKNALIQKELYGEKGGSIWLDGLSVSVVRSSPGGVVIGSWTAQYGRAAIWQTEEKCPARLDSRRAAEVSPEHGQAPRSIGAPCPLPILRLWPLHAMATHPCGTRGWQAYGLAPKSIRE